MTGLLLKDWKLLKNQGKYFLTVVLFAAMMLFINSEEYTSFATSYMTFLITMFTLNSFSYDEYDNGMPHLFSLPISKKIYVQEKYIFAILISVVGLTISTIISVVVSLLLGEHYAMEEWIGILSLSMFFVVLIQVVIMPTRIRFDAEKHKMAMLVVCGAMAAVVGGAFAIAEACGLDVESFFDGIFFTKAWVTFASVLILGAVFMWISYKLSLKFMEKREF